MWTYRQQTGALLHDGASAGTGYSGHGPGLNNPGMEAVHGIGPIPRGQWRIGQWEAHHPHLGPCVAHLSPVGHNADGRSGFFIHGDNWKMNHTASDGCIILGPDLRHQMRDSNDHELTISG